MQQDLIRDHTLEVTYMWWLIALIGLISLVAGIVLVAQPSHSLATLAVVIGIFLLCDGIAELLKSLGHGAESRALAAIIGILGIVVGIVLIRHPTNAVAAIGLLIGIWLVAAGVIRLLRALSGGARPALQIVVALLEVCVGIAVVANPRIGYATLALLVGIWLIVNGIGTIALSLAIRAEPEPAGHAAPVAEPPSASPHPGDVRRAA